MSERLQAAAQRYEQAAAELETAAQHLRLTARHFRDGEVPRGAAHAWPAAGHVSRADTWLKALAEEHAEHSRTE
jgi:hypothetical protein